MQIPTDADFNNKNSKNKKSDKINEIVKIVYDKPHNFLFINVDSQKMFKNWDELIFNEDE